MVVFGNPASNQTEQLYGEVKIGEVVTPYYVNYWYAGILISFLLTSTLLNPLVYLYYTKQRPSEATVLFRLLALLNLLTNIFKPALVAVTLIKPGIEPEYRAAEVWESLESVLHSTLYFSSVFVTILLAVSRALKIKNPFIQLPTKYFLLALLIYTPITSLLINYCVLMPDRVLVIKSQRVQSLQLLLNRSVSPHTVLLLTIYIILGAFTLYFLAGIVYLLQHRRQGARIKSSNKRSIYLILAMNCASFLFLLLSQIGIIFKFHFGHGHIPWFYENLAIVVHLILPVTIAGLNPVLVVCCNKNVRKMLRGLVCEGRCEIETAQTNNDEGNGLRRFTQARREDTEL